jgi:Lar family restriction alleviation protein
VTDQPQTTIPEDCLEAGYEYPCEECLKPCPFCGGAPRFGECDGGENDPNHGARFIECSNCHASTPVIFPIKADVTGALSDIWNRRSR